MARPATRHAPVAGPLEGAHDREHRRLAGPGGADYGDALALFHRDGDGVEREHAAGVLLRDGVELEGRHPWESLTRRPGWMRAAGDLHVAGGKQAGCDREQVVGRRGFLDGVFAAAGGEQRRDGDGEDFARDGLGEFDTDRRLVEAALPRAGRPGRSSRGCSDSMPPARSLFAGRRCCRAALATGLTAVTVPGTFLPFGSRTATRSPSLASLCLLASRSTVTTRRVDVVCRIAVAPAPSLGPAVGIGSSSRGWRRRTRAARRSARAARGDASALQLRYFGFQPRDLLLRCLLRRWLARRQRRAATAAGGCAAPRSGLRFALEAHVLAPAGRGGIACERARRAAVGAPAACAAERRLDRRDELGARQEDDVAERQPARRWSPPARSADLRPRPWWRPAIRRRSRSASGSKPRSTRLRLSCRTSFPSAMPGASSRYAGVSPSSRTTGLPLTVNSVPPGLISCPTLGSQVTVPRRRS